MYSDLADYYLRWYHERPVGITSARRDELRRLHAILYRCIDFFVHHYSFRSRRIIRSGREPTAPITW